MNLLISSARLIDEHSSFNGKLVSLRISEGIIKEIGPDLQAREDEILIEKEDLYISPGWFDSSVSLGEPGYEERETIQNGLKVAANSGFTGIAAQPNNFPVTDSHTSVRYLKERSTGKAVALHPIGALTRGSQGVDLAELYDMAQGGAIAFGDYQKAVANPNLLKLALQYTQGFDGRVISFPQTGDLVGKGVANEGIVATQLGLKGIPALAETLQIARDLHILEYSGGKLHIPTLSSKHSVALIRDAKEKGLAVTCSVAISNLYFTDDKLQQFDTRYKLLPPLRSEDDRLALIEGLKDGTIDMVCSDHNPIDIENKKMEFDHAMYGTIAQEVTFKALVKLLDIDLAVKVLTNGWRLVYDDLKIITENSPANLTLFTSSGTTIYKKEDILSKSKNSAFLGENLPGKIYGIIANNQFIEA